MGIKKRAAQYGYKKGSKEIGKAVDKNKNIKKSDKEAYKKGEKEISKIVMDKKKKKKSKKK